MKLLIYANRKQDDEIYDISTPEKEAAAYLSVFQTLDSYWSVYSDIPMISKEGELLAKARAGSWEHARKLMIKRKDYEYEEIRIAETK